MIGVMSGVKGWRRALTRARGLGPWWFALMSCGWVNAQQNLFNVPSSEITEKGEFFFQEQLNLGRTGISNTTFDYGLGHGFEVGLNLFDVGLYPPHGDPLNPEALINLQKRFDPTPWWGVGIGTQFGSSVPTEMSRVRFSNFNYLNNQFRIHEYAKLNLGGYLANREYTGSRVEAGLMFGLEIPLMERKLHFMADYLHGHTSINVGVVGFVIYLPRRWQFSIGAQIPGANSGADYGVVLEFTRQ